MAASAAFALKPGVWFRRGRLLIVSPDSLGTACPLSGRNSTYRPVQISETSSENARRFAYSILASSSSSHQDFNALLGSHVSQSLSNARKVYSSAGSQIKDGTPILFRNSNTG